MWESTEMQLELWREDPGDIAHFQILLFQGKLSPSCATSEAPGTNK